MDKVLNNKVILTIYKDTRKELDEVNYIRSGRNDLISINFKQYIAQVSLRCFTHTFLNVLYVAYITLLDLYVFIDIHLMHSLSCDLNGLLKNSLSQFMLRHAELQL